MDWLIFRCVAAILNAMIQLKKQVLIDFLPHSEYEQLPLARVGIYFQGDMLSEDYQSELWVPVVKNRGERGMKDDVI